MEYEELFVLNEFSEIIKYHNSTLDRLKRFQEAYPYLIAPNVFDVLQHNLKDNITIMFREMSGMQNQKNKQYDKKYVCKVCNKVYMISLPGGICDECRGKYGSKTPSPGDGVDGTYGSEALANGLKNGKNGAGAPSNGVKNEKNGADDKTAPPS